MRVAPEGPNMSQLRGSGICRQLSLLLWKNWIIKKTKWVDTLLEILAPVFLALVIVGIRSAIAITQINETHPCCEGAGQAPTPGFTRNLQTSLMDVPLDNFNSPPTSGSSSYFPAPLMYWACGGYVPIVGGGGGNPNRAYSQRIGIAMRTKDQSTQYQALLTDLATTIQSNLNAMAIAATRNYATPATGLISDKFCPVGGSLHNKTLLSWVSNIVRVFESADALTAFTLSPNYAGGPANLPLTDPTTPGDDTPLGAAIILDAPDAQRLIWSYDLRVNQSRVASTSSNTNPFDINYNDGGWAAYVSAGFSGLQVMVDNWIVSKATNTPYQPYVVTRTNSPIAALPLGIYTINSSSTLSATAFPIPSHQSDNFGAVVGQLLGLFLMLAWAWPFSRLVRNLVEEKEARIKEGLKMMGLSNGVFWMSWALTYLVMLLISSVLIMFVLSKSVFGVIAPGIIFIVFFLFSLSSIALAILVSAFFSRAKTAGVISLFLLIAIFFPYFAVSGSTYTLTQKQAGSLSSPIAFSLGLQQILKYQDAFTPVNKDNVGEVLGNYSIANSIGFLILDTFLYVLLAWYCDNVVPQEFGTQLPWYFPFTKSYWKNVFNIVDQIADDEELLSADLIDRDVLENTEPVTADLADRPHMSLSRLRKEFPSEGDKVHVAVDNVSMTMYEGQIFALLGHNGAGKTTTIHMMTGMVEPTRGSTKVMGMDTRTQMEDIRKMFGVCPQHDVLFPTLTVRQHLELYAALKGAPNDEIKAMVDEAISDVQLVAEDGLGQEAVTLSGGQKRRLCLAIALIAGSRILFLDEPTSGVDPFSRRAIWDLLVKKKHDRIIILTTHFMDEADQLGDRIAIMHHGKVKCLGSPLFLKAKFGVGYNITMTKEPSCDADRVRALVRRHVPSSSLLSSVGTELAFRLPLNANNQFPAMLRDLDKERASLGVSNWGLSVTTLEEVFLRVAGHQSKEEKAKADTPKSEQQGDVAVNVQEESLNKTTKLDASSLAAFAEQQTFSRHFVALMAKRWHFSKRDERAICCSYVIPLLILVLGLSLLQLPSSFQYPPITMGKSFPSFYNSPLRVPYNSYIGDGAGNVVPSAGPFTMQNTFAYPNGVAEPMTLSVQNTSLYSRYEVKDFNVTVSGATMTILGNGAYTPPIATTAAMLSFSQSLLKQRLTAKESRYGALMFDQDLSKGVVFTNLTAYQALPIMTNLYNNLLLKNATGQSSASITTTLRLFDSTASEQAFIQNVNGIFAAIVIAIAFCFVPAAYAVFVVKERESKAKHLQLISGVGVIPFWFANYFWDFMQFMLVGSAASLIILAYNNSNFVGENYGVIWVNFVLFGLSVIPFTYIFSFMFASHSTAQNVMIMIYLVGGLALNILSIVLYQFESTRDINRNVLRYLFRLLPNFAVCDTIFYLSLRTFLRQSQWDLNISGYNLIFMAVESVVYMFIALAIEFGSARAVLVNLFSPTPKPSELSLKLKQLSERTPEDADVVKERQRIQNGGAKDDLIRLEGMRKVYTTGKVAVENLWYAVPQNECFGFLGVNGAGKSSALKILTGDELSTEGASYLGNFDISAEPEKVRRLMGYCPQFDAIHELLTAEEHLYFYARLRGVPEDKLEEMVSLLTKRLTLDQDNQHLRPAGTYSGGNKRKLSVAIALIGNPPVVFLDEPSTGMDPVSRRFMWEFLTETMANRAVILTTHSMEECEALCARIGILVLGQLKCLGSSQHLKSKFGNGFQIDMTLSDSSQVEGVREFLKKNFEGAQEIECFGGSVKYSIGAQSSMKLADIFEAVELQKEALHITNYAISQTSLEQIFITFARDGDNMLLEAEQQIRTDAQAARRADDCFERCC